MKRLVLPLLALLMVSGCSHRYYAEDLKSLSEADQGANMTVADDGTVTFTHVKPCGRCVVTTTNQQSLVRSAEPLRTLATYRKLGNEVVFGQNAVHEGRGVVGVGDAVDVLEGMAAIPA